ncbi:MAG: trypsin-like serine peptidase [Sphingomonadaceae bacterium]
MRPAHPLAHPVPGSALAMLFQPGVVELPQPGMPGYDSGQFLTVLGSDDRERRTDTDQPPLRAICSLVMEDANGLAMIGTGFLVGRRTVMTCAHNLRKHNFAAAKVTVRPGREAGHSPAPFGAHVVTAADWWMHPDWPGGWKAAHDFALLRLPEPVGETTGWLGIAALAGPAMAARMVNLAGYPACVGRCRNIEDENVIPANQRGAQLWWQRDRILRTDADQLFYDLDTFGGNSGSPVILMPVAGDGWAGPTVVGIHTRGLNSAGDAFEAAHNTATRLTDALFDLALDFLAKRDG